MRRKYLIIAPAWIGDMIMAQTLFELIKQQFPDAIIDVIAPQSTIALLQFMPQVNRAIDLPLSHGQFGFFARRRIGKHLRAENYTNSIVLPNSWKSALISHSAKIKIRTGFVGEQRYVLLNDLRALDKEKLPQMAQRFCALGIEDNKILPEKLPNPKLEVEEKLIKASLEKFHLHSDQVLAICPGAEYGPSKQWPAKYFAQIAKEKITQGKQVWIFGGPGDVDIANEIATTVDLPDCINLAGKTTIIEAVALLSQAEQVLTNDSGLMHVAAALGKYVVVLYGSTSYKFTPPLTDQSQIISLNLKCSPCFKRTCPLGTYACLNELHPHVILDTLK